MPSTTRAFDRDAFDRAAFDCEMFDDETPAVAEVWTPATKPAEVWVPEPPKS
jgi:hypothetical protein